MIVVLEVVVDDRVVDMVRLQQMLESPCILFFRGFDIMDLD